MRVRYKGTNDAIPCQLNTRSYKQNDAKAETRLQRVCVSQDKKELFGMAALHRSSLAFALHSALWHCVFCLALHIALGKNFRFLFLALRSTSGGGSGGSGDSCDPRLLLDFAITSTFAPLSLDIFATGAGGLEAGVDSAILDTNDHD